MWSYNEIYHHGIKGQKWGHRRYQNEDGSLTTAGKSRYANRVDKFKKAAKIAGAVGSIGGAVGGYFAGRAIINNLKYKKHVATYGSHKMFIKASIDNPIVKACVPVGSGAVGSILGKIGTESLVMAIGGYSPSELRK